MSEQKHPPGTFISARSASHVFAQGEGPWAEFVNWLESNGHYRLAAQVHAVLPKFLEEPRARGSKSKD
jgi:hypothetical protein